MVDCGLRLTHRTENLAWLGTQKKKKKVLRCKKRGHDLSSERNALCVMNFSFLFGLFVCLLYQNGFCVVILVGMMWTMFCNNL